MQKFHKEIEYLSTVSGAVLALIGIGILASARVIYPWLEETRSAAWLFPGLVFIKFAIETTATLTNLPTETSATIVGVGHVAIGCLGIFLPGAKKRSDGYNKDRK